MMQAPIGQTIPTPDREIIHYRQGAEVLSKVYDETMEEYTITIGEPDTETRIVLIAVESVALAFPVGQRINLDVAMEFSS